MSGVIRTKSYRIDRKAYLQFFVRRGLVRLTLFVACVYFGMSLMMGFAKAVEPAQLLALVISTLIVAVLWYGAQWQRLKRPDLAKFFDLPRSLEISEDALAAHMEDGAEYRFPWSHYSRSVRQKETTLIYRHDRNMVVVPDSAFATAQDLATFQALLREKGLAKGSA